MTKKTEIAMILEWYNSGKLSTIEASDKICDLFDIRLSLPTDAEIEVLADESYKEVIKDFPIYEEYEYTQGYIQGSIVMRNKSEA